MDAINAGSGFDFVVSTRAFQALNDGVVVLTLEVEAKMFLTISVAASPV